MIAIETIERTRPINAFMIVDFAFVIPSDDPADNIYLNPP
jgi:hypothetical protein